MITIRTNPVLNHESGQGRDDGYSHLCVGECNAVATGIGLHGRETVTVPLGQG